MTIQVIADGQTLSPEELAWCVNRNNLVFTILSNYNEVIHFDTLVHKNRYEVIFLTKNNHNIRYRYKNVQNLFSPVLIKIEDSFIWKDDEDEVDAKIATIEDFFCNNIVTLLGEKISYNNLVLSDKKKYGYYESKLSYYRNIFEKKTINSYYLGRYYPTSAGRDNINVYSSRILKGKYAEKVTDEFFVRMIKEYLNVSNKTYDYFCYVPCRSNKNDRFKNVIRNNILELKKDYPETKGKSEKEKMLLMKGCFGVKNGVDVKNKKVLIIDDVLTSGATIKTIAKVLNDYGFVDIECLIFGKNVHAETENLFRCSKCGEPVRVRFSNSNGTWFLACSDYKQCRKIYHDFTYPALDYIYK